MISFSPLWSWLALNEGKRALKAYDPMKETMESALLSARHMGSIKSRLAFMVTMVTVSFSSSSLVHVYGAH